MGDAVSVYIKSIQPEKMKVKLQIIERLARPQMPEPIRYQITDGQLERWVYSPPGCRKAPVETVFTQDPAESQRSALDLLPVGPGGLLGLVVPLLVIADALEGVGQILLLHPAVGIVVGILIVLFVVKAGGVGVDILEAAGECPRSCPCATSAMAAMMALWAVLDLGAVAKRMAASARGSRASGSPSCTAASTQALVMAMAWG